MHNRLSDFKYRINANLNCDSSGIYRIICPCSASYCGKTTTSFNRRFDEHFQDSKDSSILDHTKICTLGSDKTNYKIQFLESSFNRGKFTLSEREFLWNDRLQCELNIQKILRT